MNLMTREVLSFFSPFYYQKLLGPGVIKSNRKSTKITKKEKYTGEIEKGIHVFTTLKEAEIFCKTEYEAAIVKVEVKPKDFVASAYSEAVYTKISISKREYDKVIKKVRKVLDVRI